MFKFLNTPARKSFAVVSAIVDVYSLVQIFQLKSFSMLSLLTSPWFGLFVIVTAVSSILFVYFKFQDFKSGLQAKEQEQDSKYEELRKSFYDYKMKVSLEFCNRMEEEGNLHKRINELTWKLNGIETQLKSLTPIEAARAN